MNVRPARLMAACTTFLLVAGLGTAVPADAAAKAKATKTTVSAARAVAGAKVTLTATVKPKAKVGTVRFTASGKTVGSCAKVRVRSGKARCTTTFPSKGDRTVVAKYSGKTKKYKASTGRRTVAVAAKAAPAIAASCTSTTGAFVAVSFTKWNGPVVRGCDTTPTKGSELLTTAGFTLTGTRSDGPAFICRIGHPSFDGGNARPTTAEDACVRTPPASAYWSYWTAAKGVNTWTYAQLGAYSQPVKHGDVNAWTFGATNVSGTTGQPTFTPNQVRAGTIAKTATKVQSTAPSAQRRTLAAALKQADQTAATNYLVSNLVEGHYYDPFGLDFADFGLTIDGALALAGSGTNDAALKKVVDFLNSGGKDPAGRTISDWNGAGSSDPDGGSIAKTALLAQVTGYDATNFNGHDLLKNLLDVECADANAGGCGGEGNFAYARSTFSQSLAVIALARADRGTDASTRFLQDLQLSNGGFPSQVVGDTSAEVDSTAMAAMALDIVGDSDGLAKALTWLAAQQLPDGGFPGAAGDSTNSAALAVLGFTLAGSKYADQIDKAEQFLAGQQNKDGGFNVSANDGNGSDVRASAQVVSGLAGTPFSTLVDNVAVAAPAQPDATKGAAYLVGQLVGGDHLPGSGGFENYGGTADVAIALAATGSQDKTLIKIVKYLAANADAYVDPNGKQADFPGPFTGSAGKLALIAEITGQDPTKFGGINLLKLLTDNVCTARGDGPFPACTAAGDFSQVFSGVGQALGVLALARGGVSVPPAAVTRLLQLQCPEGGFSSSLIEANDDCTPDVDTTGFAAQALVLIKTTTARDAVRDAVGFLREEQNRNGSWDGAVDESTNSTALAIQGLLAAPASADFPSGGGARIQATRSDPQVKSGRAFLATLQNTNGGFGISPASTDSDVRATAQVVPAAANATLTYLSHPISLAGAPGGSPTPTASPSSSDSSSDGSSDGAGPNSADGGTAATGVPTGQLIGLALAFLLCGAFLAVAGRRRDLLAVVTGGRHRR